MQESISVSPLLDGFAIGQPISDHNGIRCCPAIKENTDKKYIVKIVSIPASQVQMDALLLAGAYKDPSQAMDYFREKGEEVLQEAELLRKLSKLEGFLSYDGWQMEPITRHRLGYEIYLVGSYKRSLERYMRHNAITHLEAINLALDMCNALSVCRQAGALYVDLKPANIFLSDKKEYRIGDLGFLSTDALRYTALPEKYQSSYTPPELFDPMATVNMTADTYALGMILYQLYNDGSLPFRGKAPEEGLGSPIHADYELAEIIMKAIHPDYTQRYSDPGEMGKALAAYMQRNSVNDVAITPLRTKKGKKKAAATLADELNTSDVQITEEIPVEETLAEEIPDISEPESESAEGSTSSGSEDPAEPEPLTESSEEAELPHPEEADVSEDTPTDTYVQEDIPEEAIDAAEISSSDAIEKPDETEISEESEEASEAEDLQLSDELSKIIAKADDLIAHETPEGIHIPEQPETPDPFSFAKDDDDFDDSDIPYDPLMDEEPEVPSNESKRKKEKKFADPKYKRRRKRLVNGLITLLVLGLLASAGYWYYQNLYIQNIDGMTITGDRNRITVQVDSDIKDGLLTVTCLDNYGNARTKALSEGIAEFSDLQSNTMYTLKVEIDGFHRLTGKTSDFFTTEATTNIVSFTSVAGAEDGSVVLSFTVDGDEPEHWAVTYSAEGEAPVRDTFTGHSVTISGLSLGKKYTFTLDAGDRLSLGGVTSLDVTASRLILAENLSVTSADGSDMTIRWNSPGDAVVDSWDVRCYNDMGYDQTLTVTDTTAQFTGIDPAWEYTIEVTAAGMTQPARTGITANPINIRALNVDDTDAEKLKITWEHTGQAPDGGWLLLYTIDGSENYVVKCNKASVEISPKIPGANYSLQIHSASGVSVFNSTHAYTTGEAARFDANKLTADMLTIDLLKTPDEESWYYENIADDLLTDQFHSGDRLSLVLRSSDTFYLPGAKVTVLYVIRDSYGNVLSEHTQAEELVWKNIWTGGDSKNGELDVPSVPTVPGSYALDLYFDGMYVTQKTFTIS